MGKLNAATAEVPGKEKPTATQSSVNWNKYKKNRIYY